MPVSPSIWSTLSRFNRSSLWKTRLSAWGHQLIIPSADRLLYVVLHRVGLMGREDRGFFIDQLKPGMVVLDVGANIGLYSLLFSNLVGPEGRVYAFEPDPLLFSALREACAVNQRENITHFEFGLGNARGEAVLQNSIFNSGDNRIVPDHRPDLQKGRFPAQSIRVERADSLLPSEIVDFIKMDVQGWEFHALSGMPELIRRSPNVQIYFEFWPQGLSNAGSEPTELFALLHSYGLSVFNRRGGSWTEAKSPGELGDNAEGNHYTNLLAKRA